MARVESAAIHRTGLCAQPFRDIGSVRKSFRGNTDSCAFQNQESLMLVVSFINHFFFPYPVSKHQIISDIRSPKVGDGTAHRAIYPIVRRIYCCRRNDRGNALGVMLVACAVLTVRHQNIWNAWACFVTGDPAHLGLMLCRFALMVQAAVLDCQLLDFPPLFNDGRVAPEATTARAVPRHLSARRA